MCACVSIDHFSRHKALSLVCSGSSSSSDHHFVTRANFTVLSNRAGSVQHARSSCARADTKNALSWNNNDSERRWRGRALTLSSSEVRCAVKQRRCFAKYLRAWSNVAAIKFPWRTLHPLSFSPRDEYETRLRTSTAIPELFPRVKLIKSRCFKSNNARDFNCSNRVDCFILSCNR